MRLIPIVKSTISGAKREIALFFVNTALLILVYNLYMDNVIILYPCLLSGTVLLVYIVWKGITLADFYNRLENARISIQDSASDDALQARVFKTISEIHQKYLGQITRMQSQMNTRDVLFTQFIHGMKSSVSVIELACEKRGSSGLPEAGRLPDNLFFDISVENEKLKKNLEQALNLLRLDAFANDFIPECIDLAALVTHTINEHKRDFIYGGIYPKLNGSALVHTDSKWCGFIIGQLLSNAIKYSKPRGNVLFDIETFQDRTELRVIDSGIGIPPEDLPRVFDMFFTGINGRQRKESTGIGLFMAKHIADRLGIALNVDSEIGRGTTVTLSFRNLTKL